MKNSFFISVLKEYFNEPKCELNFSNGFELLVAVILSAQCTDKRVNLVTQELFKDYKTPQDFLKFTQEELQSKIHSCGFYVNKSKNILSMCKTLVENFNGQVPTNYDDLLSLAGVGRKTANVVSSILYDNNVIAVDTHVLRVSNRLGFCKTDNPNICEKTLTKKFKKDLKDLHYRMVLFGRYYCKARNPECSTCKLNKCCVYYASHK